MRAQGKSGHKRSNPTLNWWFGGYFALGGLVMLLVTYSFPSLFGLPFRHPTPTHTRAASLPPWGQLEYTELQLEPPSELAAHATPTDTLLVRLRITPETDIDALLRYWGAGGCGAAVRPLLEGLEELPGGAAINISYFFPAFARMRLYTFPQPGKAAPGVKEDCFWTAMNFLNEKPDNLMSDREQLLARLRAEYREVTGPLRFGDVMAVITPQKMVVHMCVYVADDVVFTKNGMSPTAPWVLMEREQMLKEYGGVLRVRAYRKNSEPTV